METSQSITELAAALSEAQGKLKPVAKTGDSNYGKFVELAAVLEQALPILSTEGLSVTQMPVKTEDGATDLVTMLMHKSGQWIKSTYPVRMQQTTPQGQGSAITYARRYAFMAAIGIAGEDDDGEAGSAAPARADRRTQATPKKRTSQDVIAEIGKILTKKGFSRDESFQIMAGIADVQDTKELTGARLGPVLEIVARENAEALAIYLPGNPDDTGHAEEPVEDEPVVTETEPPMEVEATPVEAAPEALSPATKSMLLGLAKKSPGFKESDSALDLIESIAGKKWDELTEADVPPIKAGLKQPAAEATT